MVLSISSDLTYVQLAFVSLILLISFLLLCPKKRLNEPILVPYKYPIIGHTIEYRKDSGKLIGECRKKYGEIFSLYVYGRVITYVGKELSAEVFRNHKNFNFLEAVEQTFPLAAFLNRPCKFFDLMIKVVQVNLSGELKSYIERVQKQLIKSIDQVIGDSKVLKPPMSFVQIIIAKPIAAALVGEELSDDKELIKSIAFITSDLGPMLSGSPYLDFIHPSLHKKYDILRFRLLNNPFKFHRELIKRKITPTVEERLSEMKRLSNNYISPTDILQRFIELLHKDYIIDNDVITDYMIVTIFASVHTTSIQFTNCLHEWVNNPQCHKEILEEQEQLYNNNKNPYYSIEEIRQMEKLDSFLKETLRMDTSSISLQHKTLSSRFTFSNGYQVPKGRIVFIRAGELHFDEEFQGQNPNEFDAFRHLNKKSSAARAERYYLAFGLGKHACPGRFFAVNEIKFALHYIFLRYNIRRKTDAKVDPMVFGVVKVPSSEGLIFEKRM